MLAIDVPVLETENIFAKNNRPSLELLMNKSLAKRHRAWAVISKSGKIQYQTIRPSKLKAIREFEGGYWGRFNALYSKPRYGYRIRRITITVDEPKGK